MASLMPPRRYSPDMAQHLSGYQKGAETGLVSDPSIESSN
jgi:hypothetical protein